MMKKTAGWGMAILAFLLLLLSLASCGECQHKKTEPFVEKEGTCQVVGVEALKCTKCGETVHRRELVVGCSYENGICVYCGGSRYGSEYLKYSEVVVGGVAGYEIVGMGNCTAANLKIPALRNGKPVLGIAAGAFDGDERLITLEIGSNVQYIGDRAFADCEFLTAVTFSGVSELTRMGESAFQGCIALKSFAVPRSLLHLPRALFLGCTSLRDLTLHDGLLTFGDDVLTDCGRVNFTVVDGASYLGSEENPFLVLFSVNDKTKTSFTVDTSTSIIAGGAFSGCKALVTVSLHDGITSLGAYAFSGCTSLGSVVLPKDLTVIGAYAFSGCTSLASVTLPSALVEIGDNAFRRCGQLTSLTLPESVRFVGDFAFFGTGIVFTEQGGCQYLGSSANPYFLLVSVGDTTLSSVAVHRDTVAVASGAFSSVAGLSHVTFGEALSAIAKNAFFGCEALTSVQFSAIEGWQKATVYGLGSEPLTVTDTAANALLLMRTAREYHWYR